MSKKYVFIMALFIFLFSTMLSCDNIDFSKIDTIEKAEKCLTQTYMFERNGVEYDFYSSGNAYLDIPQANVSGEGRWNLESNNNGRIIFNEAGGGVIDFEILDGCHLLIDGNKYTGKF